MSGGIMKEKAQQNSTESTLAPKQIEVIEALAGGASVADAARRAGVDRSTIYQWMRKGGNFDAELNLARRECADTMRARLRELAEDAVKTVREVMKSADVSAPVRLKAALSVLQSVGAMDESRGDLAIIERWRARAEASDSFWHELSKGSL
jgi:transposase-like protein